MSMLKTMILSSLLGGAISLDLLVAFQFMLCRPLVASALTGMALGEPAAGLSLGCLMELIWMGQLPVGSVVPPDFGLAAVFATAAAVLCHRSDPRMAWEACLVWALLWSLPLAWLGGYLDQAQRRWHNLLARGAEKRLLQGKEYGLGLAVGLSLLGTFVKGALATGLALLLLVKPMAFILARVYEPAREALEWMYWLGLMLGLMVLMDQFWERRWIKAAALCFLASALGTYNLGLSGAQVLAAAGACALGAATVVERRSRA